MFMLEVLNEVLREIAPSRIELGRLNSVSLRVKSALNKSLLIKGVRAEIILGGSYGRMTFLKGSHDMDFFIRFPDDEGMKQFPSLIKNAFPDAVSVRGSRSYFKVCVDGVVVDLIPVFLIKDPMEAVNTMDASAFHVDYLNARLNDALRSEVLLLKQFFKSCGVYGAESHVGGFSGYVTELLVLYFKSFRKFLEFIDSSSGTVFIDIEGFYDSVRNAFVALRVNESLTPLVIVDPVMPSRNAAAGLTRDSFNKFVLNARLFLRNPLISFFRVKKGGVDDLCSLAESRGHPFFTYKFEVGEKSDVFFSRLVKELSRVRDALEREDFSVYDYGFLDDGAVYFELVSDVLPLTKRIIGPSVAIDGGNFEAFIKREAVHGPYVLDGRVCFDVLREVTKAKPLLMSLLKSIKF